MDKPLTELRYQVVAHIPHPLLDERGEEMTGIYYEPHRILLINEAHREEVLAWCEEQGIPAVEMTQELWQALHLFEEPPIIPYEPPTPTRTALVWRFGV